MPLQVRHGGWTGVEGQGTGTRGFPGKMGELGFSSASMPDMGATGLSTPRRCRGDSDAAASETGRVSGGIGLRVRIERPETGVEQS
jgi:hypothetical protein